MKVTVMALVLVVACLVCLPVAAEPVQDTTKIVIVPFRYLDGNVTPGESRVIYGYPPDNIANRDLIAEMISVNNASIGSYGIEDPRVRYGEKGSVLEQDVRFAIAMPFSPAGDHVDLIDGSTGKKLAAADISGAVRAFCREHQTDPDCGGEGTPLLLYGAGGLAVIVLVTAGFLVIRNRRKQEGPR